MSVWSSYFRNNDSSASSQRDVMLSREKRILRQKIPQSLSFHNDVIIDGEPRGVSIIDSDNLDTKTVLSLPDEDLRHGSLVEWMDNHWLIVSKDANTEVYTRCQMRQCNYLLKWVNNSGMIVERWCIIEDGTKLERVPARDGLARWKRRVKTTPLIAGIPLEQHWPQRRYEIWPSVMAKNNVDWAISSEAPNRGTFNDYSEGGSRGKRPGTGRPKPLMWHGKDIVCTL